MNSVSEYQICYKDPSLSSISPIEVFDTLADARLYLELRKRSKNSSRTISDMYVIKEVRIIE